MAAGSFGGAFGQSFLGTLQGLTAMERAQLQMEEMKEDRERRKAFRGIAGEEMGRVGQMDFTGGIQEAAQIGPQQARAIQAGSGDVDFDRAVAESATGVMRENAARQGAIPMDQAGAVPLQGREITRQDALTNIYRRGLAVDPERAFDTVLKGMQVEGLIDADIDRKAFRSWRNGFNEQLAEVQKLAGLAETDPDAFIKGAKKFGVEIRPISIGGGKTAYEAYSGGQKVGQYADLQSAAQDGMSAYTTRLLTQGAAKFASTPDQFVSILSAADRLEIDRRKLAIDERGAARAEQLLPEQINQIRASIRASDANARKAGVETARLERMQDMNKQLEELLKDPKKNAAEILALTARMEVMFPEVYTKSGTITDASGVQSLTTTGILTPAAGRALRAGGVVSLPRELQPVIQAAADRAKGDPKKFAADRAIKNIVGSGKATIADLLEAANIKPAAEAIPTKGGPAGGPTTGRAEDFSNIFFSRATPRSLVERAAQAGNREAIAELEKRRTLEAAREAMPSNRGAFTP